MGDDQAPQARVRRIKAFRDECKSLARDGVFEFSPEQQAVVDEYHDELLRAYAYDDRVDLSGRDRSLRLGVRLTSLVGILALAVAVVLALRRSWGWLGTPAQLSVALLLPAVAMLALQHVATTRRGHLVARALPVLAFAAVVGNIEILGAAFSFAPSPWALLVYGVAGLGIAYACDSRVTLIAGALCLAGFAMTVPVVVSGAWWVDALRRPETGILVGMAYLAVSTLPSSAHFAPWWRGIGLFLIAACLIVLSQDGSLTWVPSADARALEAGYTITTLALGLAMIVIGARNDWGGVGIGGAALLLLSMTMEYFDWGQRYVPRWLFFLLVAVVALCAGWILRAARQAERARA